MLFPHQNISLDRIAPNRPYHRRLLVAVGTACAVLVAGTASAAGMKDSNASELAARYQREKAVCTSGQSNQDKATCLAC